MVHTQCLNHMCTHTCAQKCLTHIMCSVNYAFSVSHTSTSLVPWPLGNENNSHIHGIHHCILSVTHVCTQCLIDHTSTSLVPRPLGNEANTFTQCHAHAHWLMMQPTHLLHTHLHAPMKHLYHQWWCVSLEVLGSSCVVAGVCLGLSSKEHVAKAALLRVNCNDFKSCYS